MLDRTTFFRGLVSSTAPFLPNHQGIVSMTLRIMAVIVTLALFAGCAATQKPAGRTEDVVESRATVTAINAPKRLLTLKDAGGGEMVVEAGDVVKNFDQIKVGDEVVISYTEAVAWQVKSAGQGTPGVSTQEEVTRAQPGEKPAGSIGKSVTLTTTITAIDMANDTVTLTGPGGKSRTIKARDPANLRKVKVGDLVDITYSEALAVSVRPVSKK